MLNYIWLILINTMVNNSTKQILFVLAIDLIGLAIHFSEDFSYKVYKLKYYTSST